MAPPGTYDFPARKYSAIQSRWLSPDPTLGYLNDPQSFNKYGYVGNNPLSQIDPLGLFVQGCYPDCGGGGNGPGGGDSPGNVGVGAGSVNASGVVFEGNPPIQKEIQQAKEGVDRTATISDPNDLNVLASQSGTDETLTLIAQVQDPEDPEEETEGPAREVESALEPVTPELPANNVFDWMNPGPLSPKIAKTFSGGRYVRVVVGQDGCFLEDARVWGGKAGVFGSDGTFYSPTPQSGGIQSMSELGIPLAYGNTAQNTVSVYIAPGTTVYVGNIAAQGGITVGGGIQIYVPPPHP